MKLLELINHLEKFVSVLKPFNDESINIITYELIQEGQTQFASACLYIGKVSTLQLEAPLVPADTAFICVEDIPYKENSNINLCLVAVTITQFDIITQVSKLMSEEIRISMSIQKLFNTVYSNQGLQHLIDVAREVLGHPLLIGDDTFKVLAFSNDVKDVMDFLEDANGDKYINEETINYLRSNNIRSQVRKNELSNGEKKTYPLHRTFASIIHIDDIEVAYLSVYEAGKKFSEADYKLIENFSKLLSLELQRSNFFNINKNLIPNYILADLFEKIINDEASIYRRFHYLKWTKSKILHLMVITNREIGTFDSKVPFIVQSLKAFIPINNCIVYKSALVAFIDDSLIHTLFNHENSEFMEYLKFNSLYAGVSLKFAKLSESRKYYLQALKASEIGGRYNINLCYYEKCTLHVIADLISSQYDLIDFCHPAVIKLAKEDSEHNTDLIKTLKYYLYFTNAPNKAAEILCIHRSTLFYRINKIKQLTGIVLDTADENYQIYFSIKLLEISNSVVK